MSTTTTTCQNITQNQNPETQKSCYCSKTGIYYSKYPSIHLPNDPFLDVVAFIFSKQHMGIAALIDSSNGYSISYSELFPLVKSVAFYLHSRGISKGDVVLLLLPNSIFFPLIFMGVLYIGAIATTMNPLSSFSEVKKQTLDCNVSFCFTVCENAEKLARLGISAVEVPENEADFVALYKSSLSNRDSIYSRPMINQEDPAAILYSSGTTGASKGVVLTHKNFIAMIELFVRFEASQYEYSSLENVYLAVLPMFHIYGLSLFVLGLLSLGSAVVLMKKFGVNEAVEAIERYGVTHFPVVPPILAALVMRINGVGSYCLRSLKQVSCGAAPLSKKIIDEFVRALPNVDFIQGYGMTELTAVATRGYNTPTLQKYHSVGLLAPNMQAKVVDCITGSCLPPGSCGELWLRGPPIMKGYLNNIEATLSTIDKDGWLHTGDIVYFEEDGYLCVVDRLKEMIKYKGFQIAPADLEAVFISHPEILDAAVIAANDEEAGEVPVAFVVLREGSTLSQTDIIHYVARQVAPYKKVRKVIFTQSIPKSPAGKILRKVLRHQLMSRL